MTNLLLLCLRVIFFFFLQKIVAILHLGPEGAKDQNSGLKGGGSGSLRDVFMGKIDWEFVSVEYFVNVCVRQAEYLTLGEYLVLR